MALSDMAMCVSGKMLLEPRSDVPTVCIQVLDPAFQDGLQSDLAKGFLSGRSFGGIKVRVLYASLTL